MKRGEKEGSELKRFGGIIGKRGSRGEVGDRV